MELILLPAFALLGLALLIGFDGDDDSEPDIPDRPEPEPNPDLNREEFSATDDTTTGSDVTDYLFMNAGDDMASGGAGDDAIFMGAGQDQSVQLG